MDGIAAVRGRGSAEIRGETEAVAENRRTVDAGAQKGLPAPAGGARTVPIGERSQERAGCGEGRLGDVRSRPLPLCGALSCRAQIYLLGNALLRAPLRYFARAIRTTGHAREA